MLTVAANCSAMKALRLGVLTVHKFCDMAMFQCCATYLIIAYMYLSRSIPTIE